MIFSRRLFFGLMAAISLLGTGSAPARELVTRVEELAHLPPPPRAGFKVPSDPNMLFYLQRSTNGNTIVYAANLVRPGEIDPKTPIDAFWRRYVEDGRRRSLDFLQRTMAYGVTVRPVKGLAGEFDASIVSLPELKFRVRLDRSGQPEAIGQFGSRYGRLVSVYVELDESGFIPALVFMDVYGLDEANGQVLHAHLTPKTD